MKEGVFFNELLNHIPNFNNLDDISKFTFLMSQENKLSTQLLVTQVCKLKQEKHS